MQTERLITVDTHAALVMELGRRQVASAWWMRLREGRHGLEAVTMDGDMLRLELREEEPPAIAEAAE